MTNIRIPNHVEGTLVENAYILVDLRIGRYFALDVVGSTIWSVIAEGSEFDDVVARVTTEYAVSEEAARQDVSEFLHRLAEVGLIEMEE